MRWIHTGTKHSKTRHTMTRVVTSFGIVRMFVKRMIISSFSSGRSLITAQIKSRCAPTAGDVYKGRAVLLFKLYVFFLIPERRRRNNNYGKELISQVILTVYHCVYKQLYCNYICLYLNIMFDGLPHSVYLNRVVSLWKSNRNLKSKPTFGVFELCGLLSTAWMHLYSCGPSWSSDW